MDNERLDALFEAAVAIPAAERARWLDAHCNDAELRRELERLLAADAIAEGVLEQAPELLAGNMSDALGMPQRFGIWRVLGALGAGGMGEVWLAERDDGQFRQRAAIKQVAFPTPGLLRRFREERQILAKLEHPGIARLIDGGVDGSGCPWLAMEYVEGLPITQWVRERRLGVRAAVELVLRICDAVQFAHRNLVVHSDIKPSNILVSEGAPKLLDFGIAKVLTQGDTERTHTMAQLLTPDYAAPELLAGGTITTSVDVYALGVLLYELLSGHRPYRLNALGGSAGLNSAKIKPPAAAIEGGLPDARVRQRAVRGDLDRIVLTAMAYEPGRRYASVEALSSDLRRWLDGRAIAARGQGRWYRLGKFMRRNRIAVAFGAAATLALIATSIFALWQAHQAHLQAVQARIQADNADAVKDFMVGVFSSADPSENKGIGPNARALLDAGARDLRQRLEQNPQIGATLSDALAKSYSGIGAYAEAQQMARQSLALNSRLHGSGSEAALMSRVAYAETLRDAWMTRQARQQARIVLDQTHDDASEASVRAHLVNAGAYNYEGEYSRAGQGEARRALESARKLGTTGLRWQAEAWDAIAQMDLGHRDIAAAGRALRQTATLYARVRGEDAPETLKARTDLVFLLVHGGHVDEGLTLYAGMVEEQRRTLASDNPQWAETLTNYAYLLRSAGRLELSRKVTAQALSALGIAFNMPAAQRDDSLGNLAILERERGNLAGASNIVDEEDRVAPLVGAGVQHSVYILRWKHAGIAAERGDANAVHKLDELRAQAPAMHYPMTTSKQMEWPVAWLAAGQPQLALQRYRELLAMPPDPNSPVSHKDDLLLGEGIALVQLGSFDTAQRLLEAVAVTADKPKSAFRNATAHLWLGWLQVRKHHALAGLRDIEQALTWRRAQLGEDSYFTGEALLADAEALSMLGHREQAQHERAQAQALFAAQLSPNHVLSRRAQLPLPH